MNEVYIPRVDCEFEDCEVRQGETGPWRRIRILERDEFEEWE